MRKPIWYPTAPSKVYDVPERVEWPVQEKQWMHQMEVDYRNSYRSIQSYMKHHFYDVAAQGGLTLEEKEVEQKEQQKLIEENQRENEQIAAARAERWRSEAEQQKTEQLIRELHLNEQQLVEKQRIKDEMVVEQERSKTYIHQAKLVSAIEAALDNPASYEFAVQHDGRLLFKNRLHPYALKPNEVPETDSVTQEYSLFDDQEHYLLPKKILHWVE